MMTMLLVAALAVFAGLLIGFFAAGLCQMAHTDDWERVARDEVSFRAGYAYGAADDRVNVDFAWRLYRGATPGDEADASSL